MHPAETVQRFIELRAQGLSYRKIEEELGVSRPTLIEWSRKHFRNIGNLREIELEALAEQYRVTKRDCIRQLSADLERLREELAGRSLKELPTARLITLVMQLRGEASKVTQRVVLTGEVQPGEPSPPEFANPEVKWEG